MFQSTLVVSAIYSIIFALFYLVLSVYVIKVRIDKHVPFGHMDDMDLQVAIRAHGNFAEYVPLFLILLLVLEVNNANPFLEHVLGITLLVGRFLHAFSVLYFEHKHNHQGLRVGGMIATLFAIFLAAAYNFVIIFGWA